MRDALAALVPPDPRHPLPKRDPGRPKGLNVLGTFAHHPALTRAYHTFNGHVQFGTSLSARQRELLVLRLAHVRGAAYEWDQHVVQGRDAGLSDSEIRRVRLGVDAPGWDPLEAAMLAAVDELVADAAISHDTWALLAADLDTEQLMDLVFTVGAYEALAMAIGSFGVQIDDDLRDAVGDLGARGPEEE
jgi:alkylhydroperoxidase family enzyme